jgi:hypothetical protein
MDRFTVEQAARILGIKEESVRKRVNRGTLRADKDPEGRLLVYVDTPEPDRDEYTDQSVTDRDELLASKDRIIAILENQLSEEREARRRADTILAQLSAANAEQARTIRALEAPSEAEASGEAAETVEEQPERAEPHPSTGEAQAGTERVPWWRRILGGR